MRILLTNDDGYDAPGILTLYRVLGEKHDVTLVAPDREKSAVGHAISLNRPLRLHRIEQAGGNDLFAVDGTPADCVKLALFELFSQPPDLVVAGINPGSNTGINVHYSGTAAAAREAAFNGIPSMAVSIAIGPENCLDFEGMADFILSFIPKIAEMDLPLGTFLNINGPDMMIRDTLGIKITRQAENNISKRFEKREDPKGRHYFWYGRLDRARGPAHTDINALADNYISVSPLQCETTNRGAYEELKPLEKTIS